MNRHGVINLIAGRYFRSRKKVGLISVTSMITLIGTFLGTFAIIAAMSVMNGFREMIFQRTLDMEPDIRLYVKQLDRSDQDSLLTVLNSSDNIIRAVPAVERKLFLTTGKHQRLAFVTGIKPDEYKYISDLTPYLSEGAYLTDSVEETNFPEVILGISAANLLGVSPGDTVNLVSFLDMNSYTPPSMKFIVKDIFHVTVFDYDYRAYIHLADMQYLVNRPNVSSIELAAVPGTDLYRLKKDLQKRLGDEISVKTWRDEHIDLFSAMEIEKYGTFIILNLVIILAGFNLISSLVMLLLEKKWEAGILQSMGAKSEDIFAIYFRLGWLTGGSGLIAGLIFSVILMLIQQYFPFIPMPGGSDVYIFRYVPVVLKWQDVAMTLIVISSLISISSWLPARRASRILPLKALKSKQ